jgi:hypothetical protein
MDLQKLRQPTFTALEAATARAGTQARAPRQVAAPLPRQQPPPPAGKDGPLWQSFYAAALLSNHPDPEKLADSSLRMREKALALEAARHKTILTLKKPTPEEASAKAARNTKPVLHAAFRCKAKTLEGRQCTFKSTCGDFCKRHAVEKI